MRLVTYSYTTHHVPSKTLAPVNNSDTASRIAENPVEDTNIVSMWIVSWITYLPTPPYLAELSEQLKANSTCSQVMTMCQTGRPDYSTLSRVLRLHWWERERAVLTVQDGLRCRGPRLIIPSAMWSGDLAEVHEGHQGVVTCRECRKPQFSSSSFAQLAEDYGFEPVSPKYPQGMVTLSVMSKTVKNVLKQTKDPLPVTSCLKSHTSSQLLQPCKGAGGMQI